VVRAGIRELSQNDLREKKAETGKYKEPHGISTQGTIPAGSSCVVVLAAFLGLKTKTS